MKCPHCSEWVVMPLKYHVCSFFRAKRNLKFMFILTVLFCLFLGLAVTQTSIHHVDRAPKLKKCHSEPRDIKAILYEQYFKKAEAGIHAGEVAEAITYSKRPRLTAAICKVESGGKKTAFNKRSKAKGMFQVEERHWGKVNTKSALAMVAQHDVIMDELLRASNGNLKVALNRYGGDVTRKTYAKNILEEMQNIP